LNRVPAHNRSTTGRGDEKRDEDSGRAGPPARRRDASHPWDQADASAGWDRTFSLLPNTSITFSGTATLGADRAATQESSFEASPNLNAQYANRGVVSYHSSLGDGRGWTHGILNKDPRDWNTPFLGREPGPDDFAYSADPQGHLSLTIFNRSNLSMFGSFEIMFLGSVANVPGIPEPSTWLAMLVGLAVLFWRCKPAAGGAARAATPRRGCASPR
jgi:hypothetical protein